MSLKSEFRNLEMRVLNGFREKVEASDTMSKHVSGKCVKILVGNYSEIVVLNDRVTLIDEAGHQSSIFCIELETLIDILEKD
jgi:hypothetical protein